MSTYDDASLVMIPSGYKTGTVFSQKPMSTDGQLTFTRSNDTATRVASNGLIEKVRTNLFTYSEQFDNAAWTKVDTTIVANAVVNPLNGAVTADKITDSSTATTARYFFQSPASSGTIYTSSGYFKKAEYNFVTLHAFGLNGALFNLDTGVKVSQSGGVGNITSVGDGWYRCTFSFTAGGSSVFFSQSPAGNISYAGTTGSGIYAFGCQLETGDIATDYIPTTTAAVSVGPVANVPRLDYLGSSCPRLLLEPQRTNLVTFSEQFDNAGWTKSAATVTANAATSPEGYTNADSLIDNSSNISHVAFQNVSPSSTGIITGTIYIKNNNRQFAVVSICTGTGGSIRFSAVVDLQNGVITQNNTLNSPTNTSSSISNAGNGWYRVSVGLNCTTTAASSNFIVIATSNTGTPTTFAAGTIDPSYIGNGSSVFLWGAQVEAGAYATSYIPTLAASVTRGADVCSKTGISSLIGQTEGTLFAEIDIDHIATGIILAIGDGTANNRFVIQFTDATTLFCTVRLAGANADYVVTIPAIPANGGVFKMALGYKTNDYVFSLNGVIYSPSTASRAVPACSVLFVGMSTFSVNQLEGGVKQALLFKTRLDNATLASLTTL